MNHKLLLLFLSVFYVLVVKAQVNPGFTADRLDGCAPLIVNLKNTTTGISGPVEFEWDFGNLNRSSLSDAAAVYTEPGNYLITLHVKTGNKQYQTTQTITVYKKPEVNFAASKIKGCSPLEVNFISSSKPGDGDIVSLLWGFGDGSVETGYDNQMTHIYTLASKMGVSLTVSNSFGCQSTLLQKNMVEVLPTLITDFQVKDSFLCSINDAAEFTNLTKGPGTLSYEWDFGDGERSTDFSPKHFYKKAGSYIATLKASSTDGCILNTIKQVTINVQNFKTDFSYSDTLCANDYIYFRNASFPIPTASRWEFDNSYAGEDIEGISNYYSSPQQIKLKLINQFGGCQQSITKTIAIKGIPEVKLAEPIVENICGAPTIVRFSDTTPGAMGWLWSLSNGNNDTSTLRNPVYTYHQNQTYGIAITVFDRYGCKTYGSKFFKVEAPVVTIHSEIPVVSSTIRLCNNTPAGFYAESKIKITSYLWDFGDGTTSTQPNPKHIYKPGTYNVSLKYKLENGCEGESELWGNIVAAINARPDFKADSVNVCGNTPVTFTNLTPNDTWTAYEWHYGDGEVDYLVYNNWQRQHKYEKDGAFDVMLIAYTDACIDTIIKKAYIKVSPPFPKIDGPAYTCEGTRGEVKISQSSRQAQSWHWDFGDSTSVLLTKDQPSVTHTYLYSGSKKIVLTTTNGACSVADSMDIPVLIKKKPFLSVTDSIICTSSLPGSFEIQVTGLDRNPQYYRNEYETIEAIYKKNGIPYSLNFNIGLAAENDYTSPIWFMPEEFAGADGFQLVTKSDYFHCLDTTNYVPLQFVGPVPGYTILPNPDCTKDKLVIFKDTSKSYFNAKIKEWMWDFGEGREEIFYTNDPVYYTYKNEGTYHPRVTVTDQYGCQYVSQQEVVVKNGEIKVAFSNSSTAISPGTTIQFTNQSSTSNPARTEYIWNFGDGKAYNGLNASHIYSEPGVYKVTLIGKNLDKNCFDTAVVQIVVKFVNAAFSYTETYVGAGTCPPVMVRFSNSSQNITRASWNFGDGTILDGVLNPTHIFTQPGKYYIILSTWSDNGTVYTTKDSIVIRGSSATFKTDKLHSCTSQEITLTAGVENVSQFYWDFGDGIVVNARDTFAHHQYTTPGVYHPQLVYADLEGCLSSVKTQDKIVIDSLYVSLETLPAGVCSPKELLLQPNIQSIAGDLTPQNLMYHWTFGTTNPADTSNTRNPVYTLDKAGEFQVKLVVKSAYGCVQTKFKTITVREGLGGYITGPTDLCAGSSASFTAGTLLPGDAKWKWILPDGSTSNQQSLSALSFNMAGNFNIRLIVENSGCADTVQHGIVVHAVPLVTLPQKNEIVCKGSTLTLTATGALTYSWVAPVSNQIFTGEQIRIIPENDGYYVVTGKNHAGCTAKDSVKVSIVHPMTVQLDGEAEVCEMKTIQLNAAGAHSYQWINEVSTLSSTNSASPFATPARSTVYTVVGTDQYKCFTDTAHITVNVAPLPTVNAGRDTIVLVGNSIPLQPIYGNNVQTYQWAPAQYLNCSNCVNPIASPDEPITYTISVTSDKGCVASDNVFIDILCGESKIHIPNMFTPNNDGTNDVFAIRGQGIKEIRYLRIYNRFGQIIFEQKSFTINDPKGSWDGMFKGKRVDPGTYIYMAEMSCNDKSFVRKGTVTLTY
ncbi:PKD domain-containing protein [Pollutibacter soli]|uniref:PKD domain-containing protein n=1 Tax=Pollutibacter soli TaxID=3034157 RepID=UPI003013BDB5